ncbi:MAG: TM1802 family CRISPR-associated protein [bacterium]
MKTDKYIDIKNLIDTKEYFESKKAYRNDVVKQGLFLLGELIADIQFEQTVLEIDYKIMSSIDLEYIYTKDVKKLLNKITFKLQNLNYKSSILDREEIQEKIALLSDRLVDIEESSLQYSDVSFHIMAGYSFRCMRYEA